MSVDYPFHLDARMPTAHFSYGDHVRDMIEQLLFTSPGERVNRPDFGCGLRRYVFAPNTTEAAAALELSARTSLQRWLSDIISVRDLEVTTEDATLRVRVDFVVLDSQEQRSDVFVVGAS